MSHVVTDRLVSLYPEESEKYYKKAQDYTMRLNDIDQQFRRLLMTSIDRKTFVFAGYFPFQYMFEDYNINYFAKDYCGKEQTGSEDEIAADYIAAAKNLGDNIVFKAEYSNDGIINKIKSDPEIKVIELNAVHSISSQDFNAGVTFADIMDRNYRIVEEVFSGNQENR
jgi:zinc transport system substrate-binding protein